MNKQDEERIRNGILGDITPEKPDRAGSGGSMRDWNPEDDQSMSGGSQHDRTEHSGSRDVTEGTTGGTGAEVGGTRNYRQGSGATGTDIGNRPE
jgi:hypothetical protein